MIIAIRHLSKLQWIKALSIIVLLMYIVLYYIFYLEIGNTVQMLSILPILLFYWAFDIYAAICIQLLLILHRIIAMQLLGVEYEKMLSLSAFLGLTLNIGLLFTVNYLYVINKRLKVVEKKLILQNKELIITKNKAEESDRLKSAFIANISHEIRTPLNAIIGFSHLLLEPDINESEKQEFFKNIKQSGERLMQQIDGYIEMSDLMASQAPLMETEFYLSDLMKELYARFSTKAKSKTNIDLLMEEGLVRGEDKVFTDWTRLIQILNVFVDNAIKFTEKGFVKISYKVNHNNELMFWVEDTGIGISPKYKSIIFDCFRQANDDCYSRKYEGSGLGLAISKASVELLGGKIWFTSTPGKGSTFFFTVPYKPVVKENNTKLLNFSN